MSDVFLDFSGQEFYDDDDLEEIEVDDSGLELSTGHADADKSDGDLHDPHQEQGERLQKVLAHAGVGSRRMSEKLIAAGRVSVDGVKVRDMGLRVDPQTQEIRVDGQRILADPDVITVMLNKPTGVVTTMEDPQGRPTVAAFGRRYVEEHKLGSIRLVHVGRLDTDTEGLLLLSNDGQLSHRLMHPSYETSKTYIAIVKGKFERGTARKLQRGIELDDGPINADKVTIKEATKAGSIVEITLHSGRNRIVRRMLAAVGHPVQRLARTRIANLHLGSLAPGQMRALSSEEIMELQRELEL